MTSATASKSSFASIERTAEQLHLGLQDLADIVGADQSTLYRWRRGLSTPRAMACV
jgi:DNA-binding transcriptional regulator YiaG